jgi:hypothetical protein
MHALDPRGAREDVIASAILVGLMPLATARRITVSTCSSV